MIDLLQVRTSKLPELPLHLLPLLALRSGGQAQILDGSRSAPDVELQLLHTGKLQLLDSTPSTSRDYSCKCSVTATHLRKIQVIVLVKAKWVIKNVTHFKPSQQCGLNNQQHYGEVEDKR